jgi:hypothetical protein
MAIAYLDPMVTLLNDHGCNYSSEDNHPLKNWLIFFFKIDHDPRISWLSNPFLNYFSKCKLLHSHQSIKGDA